MGLLDQYDKAKLYAKGLLGRVAQNYEDLQNSPQKIADLLSNIPGNAQSMYQGLLNAPAQVADLFSQQKAQQLAQALQKPQQANPQQWMDAGMELSGMAPLGGLMAHTVYHGSPHKFDKFDMSKIGTGEGAQAYGHGLYFAESPAAASTYKQSSMWANLPPEEMPYRVNGEIIKAANIDEAQMLHMLQQRSADSGGRLGFEPRPSADKAGVLPSAPGSGTVRTAQNSATDKLSPNEVVTRSTRHNASFQGLEPPTSNLASGHNTTNNSVAQFDDGASSLMDFWRSQARIGVKGYQELVDKFAPLETAFIEPATGNLYKVDIPDEAIPRMLDWDKPLNQQAPEVQKAMAKVIEKKNPRLAQYLYESAGLDEAGQTAVRKRLGINIFDTIDTGGAAYQAAGQGNVEGLLKSMGVPGIRYLDGGSRSAGQGSSNFVLFDDQLARILERNGQPTGLLPWQEGEWLNLNSK